MDNEVLLLKLEVNESEISTLYNIEPLGIGSYYVESLTSYLVRLANKHSVSLGTLINNIIGPALNKSYVIRSTINGGNRFYDGAKSLNGIDKNSRELVSTLDALTSRNDLEKLTLNRLKYVLTNRKLLKDHLEWCPECLKSFSKLYGSCYFPLIWSINPVKYCKVHETRLVSNCPGCNKKIPILHRRSNNENCPYCRRDMKLARQDKENTISNYQIFIVENIEKLIGNTENIVYKLNRDTLTNRFKLIVQSFETNYNKSLRNELGIPKSTFCYWINGRAIPTIENLFRFCYSLGITIEDFFFKDKVQFCKRDFRGCFNSQNISERKKLDYRQISEQLSSFMIYENPLSMEEIARRIVASKRTLYRKFPDLCKSLSNRYMEEIKNRSLARREQVDVTDKLKWTVSAR